MSTPDFKTIENDEARFNIALEFLSPADKADHPRYSKFGLEYYPEVLGEKYRDCSFALFRNNEPIAIALCGTDGATFSQFGQPIEFIFCQKLSDRLQRRAQNKMITHLIGKAEFEQDLKLADKVQPTLSQLGEVALSKDGKPFLRVMAEVDLSLEITEIYSSIRKSYRPFINWGRKNIELEYVNAENPSLEKFKRYQEFHRLISGRVTRTQTSWDIMFSAICDNMAELTLGYFEGDLVSGTLVVDGARISIYASGVYDRSKFDLPISHWPLYDSILRSKNRGKRLFEIGLVDSQSNAEKKEMQIAKFKRGFANNLSTEIFWHVPVQR